MRKHLNLVPWSPCPSYRFQIEGIVIIPMKYFEVSKFLIYFLMTPMTGKVVISKWWKQALATWSVHGVFSPLSSTSGFCSETFALKISSKGQDGHVACIANGCPAIRELPETNHLNFGKSKYHALPSDWWFAQTIPFLLITIFIPFQIFFGKHYCNYLHFQASGRSSTMTSGKSRTEVTMQDPVMLQDASVTSVSLKSCHPREFQRSKWCSNRDDSRARFPRFIYIVKNK